MKSNLLIASALLAFTCTTVLGSPESLPPADQAAAFKATGFKLKGRHHAWQRQ